MLTELMLPLPATLTSLCLLVSRCWSKPGVKASDPRLNAASLIKFLREMVLFVIYRDYTDNFDDTSIVEFFWIDVGN
jgi:hypothetical protein